MTDGYDGNGGDYGYGDEEPDYKPPKRNGGGNMSTSGGGGGPHNGDHHHISHEHHGGHHHHGQHHGAGVGGGNGNGGSESILNEKANEYVRDCLTEKNRMDRKFPIAERLLDSEIEKVQSTGRIPMRELKYADIYREKPMRLSQKVLVPVREHPKFNFVGKLLGPKGNSLRRLQEETLCKMTVLGRGSMRDRVKEEELRLSKDPKYAHLSSDLHVEISTIAPPAEAYARIAYAMAELRKYLIPDSNDIIRQEQLRELMDNTGTDGTNVKATTAMASYKRLNAHTQSGAGGGNIAGGGGGGGASGTAITGGLANKSHPTHYGGYRPITQQTTYNKNVNAPKQKVLSILEKARTAMDETYGRGYEEHSAYEQHNAYDPYALGSNAIAMHTPHMASLSLVGGSTRVQNYEPAIDYDPGDYNRRAGAGGGGSDYYHQHSPGYGNTVNSVGQGGQVPGAQHSRGHVNR